MTNALYVFNFVSVKNAFKKIWLFIFRVITVNGSCCFFSQGPLPNTCCHFWLMVWQQKSKAIVMLNRVIEKDAVSVVVSLLSRKWSHVLAVTISFTSPSAVSLLQHLFPGPRLCHQSDAYYPGLLSLAYSIIWKWIPRT